jgi:hypothetical protein
VLARFRCATDKQVPFRGVRRRRPAADALSREGGLDPTKAGAPNPDGFGDVLGGRALGNGNGQGPPRTSWRENVDLDQDAPDGIHRHVPGSGQVLKSGPQCTFQAEPVSVAHGQAVVEG